MTTLQQQLPTVNGMDNAVPAVSGGSKTSPSPKQSTTPRESMHVLIAGAGIVGLTIAQGCLQNDILFTIFERDVTGSRAQGWGLTLHWCLRSLERTIGDKLAFALPTVITLSFNTCGDHKTNTLDRPSSTPPLHKPEAIFSSLIARRDSHGSKYRQPSAGSGYIVKSYATS